MKVVMHGIVDDQASLPQIVPVTPPTTAGYFTNFDLQLVVDDATREDPIMVSFGRSIDDAKERLATGSGITEISNMKNVVVFQTDLMLSDLSGHLGATDNKLYHFHSKKKIYISGKYSLPELRIESNSVPATGKAIYWILTCDYVPFRNSNFIGRKNITGLLSNELQESQALVMPFDIKNPKLKVVARIAQTTGADYNLNDVYAIVVPREYASNFVTNATVTGETLKKAVTDNRTTYGINYAMQLPISSEDSGLAVGTKYLNVKLNAGDKIFVIYHESLQSATASALEVDITIEGQVIYDGKISYVKAQFRDGSNIVPSDLFQIIERSLLGGGM